MMRMQKILLILVVVLGVTPLIHAQMFTDQDIEEIRSEFIQSDEVIKLQNRLSSNIQPSEALDIEYQIDTMIIYHIFQTLSYRAGGRMKRTSLVLIWEYDKLLNKYYQKLMSVLNDEEKEKLILSQRMWIKFRDREDDFKGVLSCINPVKHGTMTTEISNYYRSEIIRRRVEDFTNYLNWYYFFEVEVH
ncbi:lysozyme inhibitor LprI family protein [Flammeovirga sp. OC4]|uniref:lysozyme inhibitor LprI family protein n=1 Tax=Flammeovirga sp. OC4 TaxID=1382345 RepID=UPI0009E31D4B|nr:lysozyme inhibitor LprI family protein [Flammeovirga sp. OC4]